MNISPRVSVIIPVYNSELFLRRCLDSVVGQTLQDIEVLCVDDCSNDGSLAILHEYQRVDERIKIIGFSENKGVSKARNAALVAAIGEYVAFVDSDDYVDRSFLEKLYNDASSKNTDIVKCDLVMIYEDGLERAHRNSFFVNKNKFFFLDCFTTAIYRRSLLHESRAYFPEGINRGEDILFLVRAVYYAATVSAIDEPLYFYIKRPGAASQNESHTKFYPTPTSFSSVVIAFFNSVDIDDLSYSYIFSRHFMKLYSQKGFGDFEDIASRLLYIFSLCKHKETFLASCDPLLSSLLYKNDVSGLKHALQKMPMRVTPVALEIAALRALVQTR